MGWTNITSFRRGRGSNTDGERITLNTSVETGPGYDNELIRLDATNDVAKPAIAFRDKTGQTKAWVQFHDYLHDIRTYSFAAASVDTTNDQVLTSNLTTVSGTTGYRTSEKVVLTTSGVAPTGLTAGATYYVRTSGGAMTFHPTAADAVANTNKINITAIGSGTHTVTPDQTYNNNYHKHFSIELADSSGTDMQTRLSIPHGYDTTEMGVFSSNFNINGGKARILGEAATNRALEFGGTASDNLAPDGTNIRFALVTDNTAESGSNVGSDFKITRYSDTGVALDAPFFIKRSTGFVGIGNNDPTERLEVGLTGSSSVRVRRGDTSSFASYVLGTTTSSRWSIQMRNDATENLYIRDSVNGRNVLTAVAAATGPNIALLNVTPTFGGGLGVIQIANASTVPSSNPTGGGILYCEAGALKYRGTSGTITTLGAA